MKRPQLPNFYFLVKFMTESQLLPEIFIAGAKYLICVGSHKQNQT
jgi:hypothetical protein